MPISDFLGIGWKFPISIQDNKIAISEGEESIRESIKIIISTVKGERVMRPEFGCNINALVFAANNTATTTLVAFYVKDALEIWEPRIDDIVVIVSPDEEQENLLNIDIEYKVRTSNTKQNLVYPFYLEV